MRYYILETQHREDGEINLITEARQSFASALSHYHDRFSKMVMNTVFTSVSLLLVDENLKEIQHDNIKTQYVAPVVETEEE